MKHELPKLNYSYDALEPYIDAKTMEIHHTKHHQTYVDKLNAVLEKYPELQDKPLEEILKNLHTFKMDEDGEDMWAIINHGGGHLNHSLFWKLLDPSNQKDEQLVASINAAFGSIEEFKKQFTAEATQHFGSGWTWLVKDNEDGKLHIQSTLNQNSPYMSNNTPLIGLDVWEHAYYLKYQNRRAEYIEAWWKVVKLI